MDDRAIGDLPNERLAIECLPTSPTTMTKKWTKSLLRSTFANFGFAIPIFVEVQGPTYFFACPRMLRCVFYFALHKDLSTLLLLLGSVPIGDLERCFSFW